LTYSLGELAERIGADVAGDASRRIAGVRTLADAGPEHLSFLTSPKYLDAARASRSGAILTARGTVLPGRDLLFADAPQLALARALELFHPRPVSRPGAHPTAIVGEECRVDATASIGPFAVLGDRVEIGARSVVGAHVVIGDGCLLGADVTLHPHVVLYPGVRLGDRSEVHSGTVLGADGFGYATVRGRHHKIPQVGRVEIGADVEIGALSAIDRALLGATRIGAGTKVDNLVQVGHNVEVGDGSVLCGQAGIAGSAKLGKGVVLAGQAGVAGHLELGDGVQVAAKSAALETVAAGTPVAGIPAVPLTVWRRQQAVARRLPELWRRLLRIERVLEIAERKQDGSDDGNGKAGGGEA
jgi:UDP-3-O-[3-hydroxymyristoyl] glucosamine N-acyltransferase